MTTIDTHPDAAAPSGGSAVVSFFTGAADWVTTTDHKKIGRMFTAFGLLVLTASAVLGLVLGISRASSDEFIDGDALLQMFQMYRIGLVFGGVLPIGLGLSIAAAPLQLGARSLAFPRLALTGFYAWVGGMALTFSALGRNGGAGGGDQHMVDLFLAGLGLTALGLCAAAGTVATSVLTTRAPGMTMRRVPLFSWASLIGALGSLLMLPVLFGIVIYLFIDHRLGTQANFLGSEGVGHWIGWAFTVPAVIVFALPALGVGAELIPVTFKHRQVMRGVAFAGIALVGVAALSAATQQTVQDVTFDADGETFIRGAAPFVLLSGLPVLGVLVTVGLGLLTIKSGIANGAPKVRAPFVFGFFGMLMIAAGVVANALQGITDLELVTENLSTSFEEGATLLVVYGAALGVMGGLLFWAPKFAGRIVPDKRVLPLGLLGLVGTVLAAAPLLVAGFLDQVGGFASSESYVGWLMSTDQVDGGSIWITLSLIGHGVMGLTMLAFVGLLVSACFLGGGEPADKNPYGGHTVEWGTSSPAPADNYDHVATVASAEPQFDMTYEGSLS